MLHEDVFKLLLGAVGDIGKREEVVGLGKHRMTFTHCHTVAGMSRLRPRDIPPAILHDLSTEARSVMLMQVDDATC